MIAEEDKQEECTETDMISPESESEAAKKQTNNFDTPKRSRKRRITIAPEEYSPNHKIMYTVKILLPSELKMYPSQQIAMGKVIQALNKKQNVLIESPTGSGKTMALLASSCAWLQRHKLQQICLQHPSDADNSGIQNDNNNIVPKTDVSTDMKCTCIEKKKIQIYYATRTHTQISQVIKEFERLPYGRESGDKQLRHTILASREQSCVNVELREHAIKEVKDLKEACKEATDLRNCKYRNNLFKKYEDPRQPNELRKQIDGSKIDGSSSIWDIEDIAETLKNLELCPYYATNRLLIDDADIIFTPFNYLINQTIRNSSRIDLENSIVILDEAHNVENICRDSASFSFKETEFHVALKFLNILIWKIVKELEKMSENPSIEKDILLEQKRILQKVSILTMFFSLLN
uniref:Helicase ATP-binding domain-containing protein n=1 Tax=Panagrolaimus superbus TaxID=310955 RepID=A0A914XVM4_9BILA